MSTYLRKSRRLPDLPGIVDRRELFPDTPDLLSRITITVKTLTKTQRALWRDTCARYGLIPKVAQRFGRVDYKPAKDPSGKFARRGKNGQILPVYQKTSYSVSGPWEFMIELCYLDTVVDVEYREERVPFNLPGSGPEAIRRVKAGKCPDHTDNTSYYPPAERIITSAIPAKAQTKVGRMLTAESLSRENQRLSNRKFRARRRNHRLVEIKA